MKVRLRHHITSNINQKRMQNTSIYTYVLFVHGQHVNVPCNKRKSTQNRHQPPLYVVKYLDRTWWVWAHNLILYPTPTTNTFKFKQTAIQTYFLVVQIEPTRHHSIHAFNVCRVAIAIIAYLNNTLGWDYGLILHWTPIIPPSNPITHTYTQTVVQTYVLFVQDRRNTVSYIQRR